MWVLILKLSKSFYNENDLHFHVHKSWLWICDRYARTLCFTVLCLPKSFQVENNHKPCPPLSAPAHSILYTQCYSRGSKVCALLWLVFSPPDDEITKSTDPRVLCSGGCELPGEMGRTYQLYFYNMLCTLLMLA